VKDGNTVIITGRKDPKDSRLDFRQLPLSKSGQLKEDIETFVGTLPHIDAFVYAAGFYQEGTVTELGTQDIKDMLDVGINAPIWFVRELLQQHGKLEQFVAVTSTSQWTPRLKEPIYTAVKAALGHFANSVSLDPRVHKTLVAGPAGMNTDFWHMTEQDQTNYNTATWVAGQIYDALTPDYSYAFIRVLRDPARTELVETRA
jgi:NADP-dependent 3-hydroxy acid dehydrogenase YdfG